MRRGAAAAIVLTATLVAVTPQAMASPGDLDPAFSGDGYQTLRVSPLFSPTGVAADGSRITVAGNAATYYQCHRDIGCFTDAQAVLARYRADGTLDPAFGQGGVAKLPEGDGRTLSPGTMLVPKDGDTYALSSWNSDDDIGGEDHGVWHFDSSGRIDDSFPLRPDPNFEVSDIAAAPDGLLVWSGDDEWHTPDTYAHQVRLARTDEQGDLDSTFGNDGIVHAMSFSDPFVSFGSAVSVAPDGSILVTSVRGLRRESLSDLVVALYGPDGSPVESFGDNGRLEIDLGEIDSSPRIVPTSDGGWLIGDSVGESGSGTWIADQVVKLDEQGNRDPQFGVGGVVELRYEDTFGRYGSLDVDDAGRILVSGPRGLTRLRPDGSVDTAFGGGDGRVGTPWLTSIGAALLPDGRVARFGSLVDGPGAALVVHGTNAAIADADADRLGDADDRCVEVPGGRPTGCPQLSLSLELLPRPHQGMALIRDGGTLACRNQAWWTLVRRRGDRVKRFRIPDGESRISLHGWGKYRLHASRRVLPESGICPDESSAVRFIEKRRR